MRDICRMANPVGEGTRLIVPWQLLGRSAENYSVVYPRVKLWDFLGCSGIWPFPLSPTNKMRDENAGCGGIFAYKVCECRR